MPSVKSFLLILVSVVLAAPAFAQTGTIVFNNIPATVPGNVPSQGYECCSVAEFGDLIRLEADTPRRAAYATVLMSSWALHSTYPSMPAVGYTHPITLAIYATAAQAAAHEPIATLTQTFAIPWRPEADPTCPGGTAWRFDATTCFNGFAFEITFDLRSSNVMLPDDFIYGVAFNTRSWGYAPLGGGDGPYNSLNVGTANVGGSGVPPSVGVDVVPSEAFVNYAVGAFYSDGGAGGVGSFRADTGWTGFAPAVTFTTFAIPQTAAECKNGAWANLARADFSPFKNQGACVSYVNTGK